MKRRAPATEPQEPAHPRDRAGHSRPAELQDRQGLRLTAELQDRQGLRLAAELLARRGQQGLRRRVVLRELWRWAVRRDRVAVARVETVDVCRT
jgi:hypothetical protein